ncbi:hypothetical protein Taro_000830 [Colocasia esculenta]|uniref:Cyclin n=1 Tax=Colocasia esculenta TaxID=4460 RepID=A0A843TG06_COLES|nr:hypothetical protein [Colocasia esculenta]
MAELENEGPHTMPRFVGFLSSLLQRVAESNDTPVRGGAGGLGPPHRHHLLHQQQQQQQKVTVFHGLTKPAITVRSYLERIFTYANCSPSCYVVAYIYLDRFSQRQPLVTLNSLTVHRLLVTSIMVAAKFMDDVCYNNAYFAKVGGISTLEINFLERDFLFGLGFRLNVTPAAFQSYCSLLQREMCLECPASPLRLHCFFFSDEEPPAHHHHHQQQQQHQRQLAV